MKEALFTCTEADCKIARVDNRRKNKKSLLIVIACGKQLKRYFAIVQELRTLASAFCGFFG